MLPDQVKDQIMGVVLYGDTRNQQDGGRIADFSTEKVHIICNEGGVVCEGQLIVAFQHLLYVDKVPGAVEWLMSRLS
jgi:cutinase